MARLREGFASGDTKMIFEGAHALKGVTANLGFTAISGAAAELADEFRPGRDRRFSDEEVNARLAALNERYDATVEEIAKFAAK
jgi:HPt (histidine-containing phosphotransfer) domain-containing protein